MNLDRSLRSLRVQTKHAATDRDNHIASAQKALTSVVDPARLRRADLKGTEERVQEIWAAVEDVRKTNERTRGRIRSLRNALASRRRTLAIASSTFHSIPGIYHASTSCSPSSTSTSPSHGSSHSPTPPGSFPHNASPLSASPQAVRPTPHRRGSSSYSASSLASTPPTTTHMSRPSTATRASHGASPPVPLRQPQGQLSSSPQTNRGILISQPSVTASPHPYAHTHIRAGASGAHSTGVDTLARQIDEASHHLMELAETIAKARSGLVQELVEVFSVVEVGGRPPIGGKAGTKGEWTIGGLVLPVPGDMRRYPPDHVNAVITHSVHFLTLLAFYLGIKLPFEIVWSQTGSVPPSSSCGSGLLGVGSPWVGAIKGGESGGWARWTTKYPLHLSSSVPLPASSSSRPPNTPSLSRATSAPSAPPTTRTLSASLADSQIDEPASSASSFTTALAMLLYDVCYLADTQGVEVPLAQAGEVLGNLWTVCCSPELGKKSHATRPLLPPPTPSTFPLDFAQLLQATAANPTRPKARGTSGREKDREKGRDKRHAEQIVEEDEGWDFVEAGMD